MSRTVNIRKGAYAAVVAAALVFGAATVPAGATPAAACADRYAQGTCTTDAGCNKYCRYTLGAAGGACNERTTCCYCYEVIDPPVE